MSADRLFLNGKNGTSDPSTSNLIALAKLYGVSAEELLKSVTYTRQPESTTALEEDEK